MVADVLIIGGGVAGVGAAQVLAKKAVRFVLVDARPRLGGRIHTAREPGWPAPIELGAEFVHGRPKVLRKWLGRKTRVDDSHLLLHEGRLTTGDDVWDQGMELLAKPREDRPFLDWLRAQRVSARVRSFVRSYVEGFHAADPERASARAIANQQAAAEEEHADAIYRVDDGYDSVVQQLIEDVPGDALHLDTRVERLRWRRGRVEATVRSLSGRHRLIAKHAIITVPHSALLRVEPRLGERDSAARRLAMGPVVKLFVWFRRRFWPEDMSFAHGPRLAIPTWWTLAGPLLVGWAGGPPAARLSRRKPETVLRAGLHSLQSLFHSRNLIDLVQAYRVADWQIDPLVRGAYSWVPVGGLDSPRLLSQPIESTLFFAGEATNTENETGTVHGALATGQRAAAELLSIQ